MILMMMMMMMMMMTNRTRGAVALPNPMGPFRARLSKEVLTDGLSDYWERRDDSAWYRIHVGARKKFFGTTNEDLPPGGPSHDELDTVRVTHMRGLDAVGNWVRDVVITMLLTIGTSRVDFGQV